MSESIKLICEGGGSDISAGPFNLYGGQPVIELSSADDGDVIQLDKSEAKQLIPILEEFIKS